MGTYKIVVGLHSTSGNLSLIAGAGVTSIGSGEYQTGTLILAPTCSITSFGAVGDGVTDNAAAIQKTFNYAATNNCIAFIPAGTFAYSGNITATSIAVAGTGLLRYWRLSLLPTNLSPCPAAAAPSPTWLW